MSDIVSETLESLKEYIPKMIAACEKSAENFQTGNENEALQLFPDIVEGMQWIIQAIAGLQANEEVQSIEMDRLTPHFNEMLNALEIGDYVLLADLLNYEVAPALAEWNTIMDNKIH